MIRIETKAGHGAGKPTAKVVGITEYACALYMYIMYNTHVYTPNCKMVHISLLDRGSSRYLWFYFKEH